MAGIYSPGSVLKSIRPRPPALRDLDWAGNMPGWISAFAVARHRQRQACPSRAFRSIFIDFPGLFGCPMSAYLRDSSREKGRKSMAKSHLALVAPATVIGTVEAQSR